MVNSWQVTDRKGERIFSVNAGSILVSEK
jgi:hypothetical protein